MQQTTTRVPALLNALTARLEVPLTEAGWQFFDGPPASPDVLNDVFMLGRPDETGTAVTVDSERAPGLTVRYDETFNVWCLFSHLTGDTGGIVAARARVKAGLDIVDAALREDRGVGGVVDLAYLGGGEAWAQVQTEEGLAVECLFAIEAKVVGR